MSVTILYNSEGDDAASDQHDVIVQRDAVALALNRLGYEAIGLACNLNLNALRAELTSRPPEFCFNLVESLGGTDRLMPLVPLLLDAIGVPYTGAPSLAMQSTTNKVTAKGLLRDHGLPTPDWVDSDGILHVPRSETKSDRNKARDLPWVRRTESAARTNSVRLPRFIIKPVWEHASRGMDDTSVVRPSSLTQLVARINERQAQTGCEHFAERFVAGREFNVTVLAGSQGPRVLPPAEIDFSAFPPDKPRIVGYRAKWDSDSFEYAQTPRRFRLPAVDHDLLEGLAQLSRTCWTRFGFRGYARVDFRVDTSGRPWILEINANPCLSPDAGFAAAVAEAELSYDQAIRAIVQDVAGLGAPVPMIADQADVAYGS